MEILTEQLRQRFLLVEHFQNQIYTTENTIRNKMNENFEQIRASDRQQIKQLQDNLELIHQSSHTIQGLGTQCDELIENLNAILTLIEGISIEISAFITQASKINENLEVSHHKLYLKVDAIHNLYNSIYLSLKDIYSKEKEARSSQSKFQ
jgi:hypothetical protein